MGWLLVIRKTLALTLAVTLASMGVPVPVNASGEQERPSARNRVLTLNGRPIRQFVSTTRHSRDAFLFSGLTQARPSNGQIGGVALDRNGQALADHAVQLKRGHSARRQLAAETTTDAGGQFSFTGLNPGRYAVEIVADGKVIATRTEITLSGTRAMVVNGITVSQPAERSWVARHQRPVIIIGMGVFFGYMAFVLVRDARGIIDKARR